MAPSPAAPNGAAKNHKVEGKNKKSLHQKQQQTSAAQQHTSATNSAGRRSHQKNPGNSGKPLGNSSCCKDDNINICSTVEEFSKRAQELKADINKALEKQANHQTTDQPVEVVKLKDDILKLSGIKFDDSSGYEKHNQEVGRSVVVAQSMTSNNDSVKVPNSLTESTGVEAGRESYQSNHNQCNNSELSSSISSREKSENVESNSNKKESSDAIAGESTEKSGGYKSDAAFVKALNKLTLDEQKSNKGSSGDGLSKTTNLNQKKKVSSQPNGSGSPNLQDAKSEIEFQFLNAELDSESKFAALVSSLQEHFTGAPHLLEPVCRELVKMSDQNVQLVDSCSKFQAENSKLLLVKQKLENLCRELQKSNNAIRIESLNLIKAEQGKAKDQTTKIQSTLSGVIRLFDENQQRNMSLRQENQELQTKLKSLLDHCDNWEKGVEAALRQREIENRLLKTELAKANLVKNEEKEKFLSEKQELLHVLSMMQEQQHRIEDQEAKLRSDLSSYASKYDECQAVINKGMSRFQTESKRMLKQIEKSKQDYKVLFLKYESCNKKMAQLLEEKQYWDKAMNQANKKIGTLEKLCRALQYRKDADAKEGDLVDPSAV